MVLGVLLVGLQQIVVDVLHTTSVRARSSPSASNSCITSVPVASWVNVWSMWRAISSPGVTSPDSKWDSISLRATLSEDMAKS